MVISLIKKTEMHLIREEVITTSDYILTSDGELMHYGVPGMKWGVRRASKQLAKASTKEDRDKAIAKLNKHRSKASAEIAKLDKKRPKLQKEADKYSLKQDKKAAKLELKSAKLKKKASKRRISTDKAAKLLAKSMKMDIKSSKIRTASAKAKSKLAKNQTLTRKFNEGISTIDRALIEKGRRVIGE